MAPETSRSQKQSKPQRLKAALLGEALQHHWKSCPSQNTSASETCMGMIVFPRPVQPWRFGAAKNGGFSP
jgi:hypothetical protein